MQLRFETLTKPVNFKGRFPDAMDCEISYRRDRDHDFCSTIAASFIEHSIALHGPLAAVHEWNVILCTELEITMRR